MPPNGNNQSKGVVMSDTDNVQKESYIDEAKRSIRRTFVYRGII